jgi:predicted RNase H-like HicB family nuclease
LEIGPLTRKFTVILETAEEGGYVVRCLEIPGAISQGETKDEALENIKEAIQGILELRMEDERRDALQRHAQVTTETIEVDG